MYQLEKGLALAKKSIEGDFRDEKRDYGDDGVLLIRDYSNEVKKSFANSVNQGRFIREVFKAAGYNRFPTDADEDYAKKICNGTKPITDDMRAAFPHPYHLAGLAEYFEKRIDNGKVLKLAENFGILENVIDIEKISKALAIQFFKFVDNGGSAKEEENIVPSVYTRLLEGISDEDILSCPQYDGDSAWVTNWQQKCHYETGFYEKFSHVWLIRNYGKVSWKSRQLICRSKETQRIKLSSYQLDLPDIDPGHDIEVTVKIDTRGQEGVFESVWEMVDIKGQNCFPNDKTLFNFKVTVKNKSRNVTEAM